MSQTPRWSAPGPTGARASRTPRAQGLFVTGAAALLLVGCGSTSTTPGAPTSTAAGGAAGAGGGVSAGGASAGAAGMPFTAIPPCTLACDGGQVCVDGACSCPPYQQTCGGQCIPVVTDPNNCGGCGVTCSNGTACSGGSCQPSCLPGQTPCAGSCVDTSTDAQNCGGCGAACGAGTSCIWGTCGPATTVTTPSGCASGGPALTVTIGGASACLGNLGARSFGAALCSCQGINVDDTLVQTDAFLSTAGPYAPGQAGGDVGLDGALNVNGTLAVGGSLVLGSTQAVTTRTLSVGQELHASGTLQGTGPTTIAGDAFVDGAITTSDPFAIAGALHQPTGSENSPQVTYGSRVEEPVSVPPPCDCAPDDVVPIAQIVTAHATVNDDDLVGLDPDLLADLNAPHRLDLPCGSFYLSAINVNDAVVIYVHGRTALYVGGDVGVRQVAFALDPDAELDVFVAGDVNLDSPLSLGSPSYPALARLYVAGKVEVNDAVSLNGFLYAPNGQLNLNAPATVYGGVFVGDFVGRATTIHYDQAITQVGTGCAAGSAPAASPTM